jgi:hypothetical protein
MLLRNAATALLATSLLAACADEETDAVTTPDATSNADASSALDAGADDGSGTDAATDVENDVLPETTPRVGPSSTVFVAQEFIFERENPPGVTRGFNLDSTVTDSDTAIGCGQNDFLSPEGGDGIDNQFALLLPIIEAAGGSALPLLVQSAINEGDLLIVIAFEGLDDTMNDDDVTLTIARAQGTTLLGSNRLILPWQTFDLDTNESMTRIEHAVITDGVLTAASEALDLPIFVFGFRFEVTLNNALIRGVIEGDQVVEMMVGGAITLENVLDIARTPGIQDRIPQLIESVGGSLTDSSVNEDCDAFSVTATMYTIPAFLYAE